jgi:predicted RNA binding protein YcfA (HicA-like mRNA interferase family)
MPRFPADAPLRRVIKTLERLGFHVVREGNHIAMVRENPDGTRTPLTMPNHSRIKGSTLRTILTHSLRQAFQGMSSWAPTRRVERTDMNNSSETDCEMIDALTDETIDRSELELLDESFFPGLLGECQRDKQLCACSCFHLSTLQCEGQPVPQFG